MLTSHQDPDAYAPLRPVCAAPPLAPYGVEDARRAWDSWGANCGPWAVAALLGVGMDAVRPLFPWFPERPYTKETDLRRVLDEAGLVWSEETQGWPAQGLVRMAWHGPWWDDVGVDPFARLRRSHWVATLDTEQGRFLFDGNAIAEGGWVTLDRWSQVWAPWIASLESADASGAWRLVDRFVCGVSRPFA